ncbi:membrane protein [Spirochaetia bacterium]|nr:membrane protein [Spirochaetia bacterium]
MKENSELRSIARSQLKGSWLAAVGVTFIYMIIVSLSGFTVVGPIILGGPLAIGFYGYFIRKARNETVKLENLFDGFKLFGSSFLLFLLQMIFITLWTCLLFIPGIVKSFSYSMAFYILRDNPNLGASEAITASRKMMNGYKGKLFGLYLSFIGWALLSVITLGIGVFWLIPYMQQATADFYEDLKGRNEASIAEPNGQSN